MKTKRTRPTPTCRPKPTVIRTTFMELLQELSRLTTNDDVVLAVVKNIFHTHRIRLARSLAPVCLVNPRGSLASNRKSSIRLIPARLA